MWIGKFILVLLYWKFIKNLNIYKLRFREINCILSVVFKKNGLGLYVFILKDIYSIIKKYLFIYRRNVIIMFMCVCVCVFVCVYVRIMF